MSIVQLFSKVDVLVLAIPLILVPLIVQLLPLINDSDECMVS